jgi:hypothetical protein
VALEEARVAIQPLHDREPDRANLLERLVRLRVMAGGILPELVNELLEALVAPVAIGFRTTPIGGGLGVGVTTVGAHLDTQVAQLGQDRSSAGIEIARVLSFRHGPTVAIGPRIVNVSKPIQGEGRVGPCIIVRAARDRRGGDMLKPGDPAPDFTGRDHTGKTITLSQLRGKNVVLWFYPKADTPG